MRACAVHLCLELERFTHERVVGALGDRALFLTEVRA
jgi:hypothetical protein